MSDKTNEEKLRILQERLTQIQNKQEVPTPTISAEQAVQTTQLKEEIPKVNTGTYFFSQSIYISKEKKLELI